MLNSCTFYINFCVCQVIFPFLNTHEYKVGIPFCLCFCRKAHFTCVSMIMNNPKYLYKNCTLFYFQVVHPCPVRQRKSEDHVFWRNLFETTRIITGPWQPVPQDQLYTTCVQGLHPRKLHPNQYTTTFWRDRVIA